MGNPCISIIVPVYNVPTNYLKKCIESTISQTLSNIEILLVDDGSTDSSGSICDEYAKKDKRITVIHKKNEGLSATRNTGVENATGKWIMFLDGDDWIEPDTCKLTYETAENNDVDLLMFKAVQEFKSYRNPFKYKYDRDVLFEKEECRNLIFELLVFNSNISTAWAKLIKRDLLLENNIKHNKMLKQGSEGIEFNVRLFRYITKAYFLNRYLYHYVYNDLSISSKHDVENHMFVIKCFSEIKRSILEYDDPTLLKQFYVRFSYVIIATAISGYFNPSNNQTYKEKCNAYKKYLSNSLVSETMQSVDSKMIESKRRVILFLIKHRMFLIISLLAKIRKKQKISSRKE